MSIKKFLIDKDSTITSAFKPFTTSRAYYANMGAADSLEFFSIPRSGSQPEISRILLNFPISDISSSRTLEKIPTSGNVNFFLKLFNVEHPETLPKNYTVLIKPISGSWEEGEGLDLEGYTDVGVSGSYGYGVNWLSKSSTETPKTWSSPGGDFYNSFHKTFYFETGEEDLEVDVTDLIEAILTGSINTSGVGIMLSGSFESGSDNDYYTKRFSARSSEYFYKVPTLEARWESSIKDDRSNFYYESDNLSSADNEQSLYFYNIVNGTLKNLPNDVIPLVNIENFEDNQLLTNIQSTKVSTGVYRANFSITGSIEQTLYDKWFYNTKTFFNGEFDIKERTFSDVEYTPEYVFSIKNLKSSYSKEEKATIKIFIREKNWSPNIYKTAINTLNSLNLKNLYYKIFRVVDNLVVLDYGIQPVPYTKCSYDKNGNYFNLDMSLLEPGYLYGIKLMYVSNDEQKEIPNVFHFKVE